MDLFAAFQHWLPRLLVGFVIIMTLVARSAIPNPFNCFWLTGTKVDRLVTYLRLTIPWTLFCSIESIFFDMRIRVRQASGKEHTWFLLRDEEFGPIRIADKMSRLTLILYHGGWPYFPERLCELLRAHYEQASDPLVSFEATMYKFSSLDSAYDIAHRLKPITADVVFRYGKTGC